MTGEASMPRSSENFRSFSNGTSDSMAGQRAGSDLVGVIDEGTKTVTFSVYTTPDFKEVAAHSVTLGVRTPQDGWYEQDPMEMLEAIEICARTVIGMLPARGYSVESIATIGVTNQRETVIVWDAVTGKPFFDAIVWKDIRTAAIVEELISKLQNGVDHFKYVTGLPISTCFSAPKIRWILDNVPEAREACRQGRCRVGTVDTWIIWHLTNGGLHITDITNASRTLLMNIETEQWDPQIMHTFSIEPKMLAEIRSCSELYGSVTNESSALNGIRISGILGNQQASLLGQMCIKPGQTKNTYRSGCFLLCNTGNKPVFSPHGLLTTVAYKLGPNVETTYAIEGSVSVAGHALTWLQNRVRILPNAKDADHYAEQVPDSGGVCFVPALTGLCAPYWNPHARGILIGLTQYTTRNHIIRAALEAICFQTRDLLECMRKECGYEISRIHVDGRLSASDFLMQVQSDSIGVPVFRSKLLDTTAFGAAMCAAQAAGIELCKFDPEKRYYDNVQFDTFLPTSTDVEREYSYAKWKRAVERSLGWVTRKPTPALPEEKHSNPTLAGGIFLMSSFAMLVHSASKGKS